MYSVTINLSKVKNTDDLMLQLVWVMRNLDRQHEPVKKESESTTLPLTHKGCLRFGTIEVRKDK